MKNLKPIFAAIAFSTLIFTTGCNNGTQTAEGSNGSGSATETTPNDSSGTDSKSAMGTNADNQKKESGYPSNQSNLNSDSTSRKHDLDTTKKK